VFITVSSRQHALVVAGIVGLVLFLGACAKRYAVLPDDTGLDGAGTGPAVGRVHLRTCEKCGECAPHQTGDIITTLMHCPGQCCNSLGITFECQSTSERFMVTIGECDRIEWDTPDGIVVGWPPVTE